MIDNGDVSCLWTDKDWNGNVWSDCKYQTLTYAMRGDDCPPRIDVNLIEYLGDNEEFAYLFTNGEWVCYELGETTELIEIPSGAADDD